MFKTVQFKAKPTQSIFRRNLMDFVIKKAPRRPIEFNKPDTGMFSKSLGNGLNGSDSLALNKMMKTFSTELPKAFGALMTVGFIFVFWPLGAAGISNINHSVPHDNTAAVKLMGARAEPVVNIPQTYARRDKPADDE